MSAAQEWISASLIRCDAATGPWAWDDEGWLEITPTWTSVAGGSGCLYAIKPIGDEAISVQPDDAAFIAAARDDLPKALAALRAVLAFAEQEWGPSPQLPSVLQPYTYTARIERVIAEALGVQP